MRIAVAIAANCLFLALPVTVFGQSADDGAQCQSENWDKRIEACTRIIQDRDKTREDRAKALINRSIAYMQKGDDARADADDNRSIWLDPKDALAFYNRANLYFGEGDYGRAIAGYSQAIRIDPQYAPSYANRGDVHRSEHDYDDAIADYTQAIKVDPKYSRAYLGRGIVELYTNSPANAYADFTQAGDIAPDYAFAPIWLEIANKRDKLPSRLDEATAQVDMTKWPAPVIRLYLGQVTPDALLAAADDPYPAVKAGQTCEANFYTGELALLQGRKNVAALLFNVAASQCPQDYDERFAAEAELKAPSAPK
jgi:lipoprotein NlpI